MRQSITTKYFGAECDGKQIKCSECGEPVRLPTMA